VIALFRQKSPANLVLLLIFGLLIKMSYLMHPQAAQVTQSGGLLYAALLSLLGTGAHMAASGLAFALLYFHSLMINYVVNEHRLTTKHSFLPAMAYLLITSLLPEWNLLSPPLLASTLIIWAFLRLFRLYNKQAVKGDVFNIGLVLGLSSMIFFPSAAFLFCLLLGLLILRPFSMNEIILFLIGCLTPYYFYSVYLFLTDQLTLGNVFPSIILDIPQVRSSIQLAIAAALLAIPFVVGSWHIQAHLRKMLIQVRKNWSIMLMYLLLALFVPFINSNNDIHNWVLAMPAFAAFHACAYLYPTKKWVPLVLFWCTVLFVLYQQYGAMFWKG
jgi:hypothetical protein